MIEYVCYRLNKNLYDSIKNKDTCIPTCIKNNFYIFTDDCEKYRNFKNVQIIDNNENFNKISFLKTKENQILYKSITWQVLLIHYDKEFVVYVIFDDDVNSNNIDKIHSDIQAQFKMYLQVKKLF